MRSLLVISLSVFLACTLPREDLRKPVSFLPEQEQLAINITRQGSDYFLKGRYIEAEMKFRQAAYLFPETKNIEINLINTLIRSRQYQDASIILKKLVAKMPFDLDVLILQAKYQQAAGDYQQAIIFLHRALEQATELKLLDYQSSIAENLSSIYFLIGEESDAISYEGLSYTLLNNPITKANYARLQVGVGLQTFSNDLKVNPNRLLKTDQDFLSLQLLMTQARDPEASNKLINQIELLGGTDAKLPIEVQFLQLLNKAEWTVEDQEKFAEVIIPYFYSNGALNTQIALYWPVGLIKELESRAAPFRQSQ